MQQYRPVARTEIVRQRKSLDDAIERAESASDLEMRADLARYCCMRLAGFFEQALLSLGTDLLRRTSGGPAQTYGLSFLGRSFNPTSESVLQYVGRFSPEWKGELEVFLGEEERGQQLNALVGVRNQLAHGQSQSVGIERVKQYRKTVDQAIDILLEKFEPPS